MIKLNAVIRNVIIVNQRLNKNINFYKNHRLQKLMVFLYFLLYNFILRVLHFKQHNSLGNYITLEL